MVGIGGWLLNPAANIEALTKKEPTQLMTHRNTDTLGYGRHNVSTASATAFGLMFSRQR